MTLSTGPWWCAPVFAFGWMTTVPAHSFSAPARAVVIAAARLMPGVCGVLGSSSSARTTRTPSWRQSDAMGVLIAQVPLRHALSRDPAAAAARDAGPARPRPRDAPEPAGPRPAALRAG